MITKILKTVAIAAFPLASLLSCGGDEPVTPPEPSPDTPFVIPPVLPGVDWEEDTVMYSEFQTILPPEVAGIDGLTEYNFPVIDGSDSTQPLRALLAISLLKGYVYHWNTNVIDGARNIFFAPVDDSRWDASRELYHNKLKENNTHPSFVNLIDGTVNLIICARESSDDELAYAREKGVTLVEKPIALDSFAFLLNRANRVNNLSHEQIVAIYSGKITNWSQAGGDDQPISAFTRNRNSGSQEKMDKLVMKGTPMLDLPELRGGSMMSPYWSLELSPYGIAYSPYYYYLNMSESTEKVKAIAVNSVPPTKEHIRDRSYPFVSDVVACIRTDTPAGSYARKIFDYLTTPDGKRIIEASGYVAN